MSSYLLIVSDATLFNRTRYTDRAQDKTRKEARALVTVMPEDELARSKIFRDDDGDEEY